MVLALGVAAVDFSVYVTELASGGASQVAVSVLERIATALVLAWMLAIAREAYRPQTKAGGISTASKGSARIGSSPP